MRHFSLTSVLQLIPAISPVLEVAETAQHVSEFGLFPEPNCIHGWCGRRPPTDRVERRSGAFASVSGGGILAIQLSNHVLLVALLLSQVLYRQFERIERILQTEKIV